jgi:hypothetical protein
VKRWIPALAALFVWRLVFGLCHEFFFEDETQIFLLGLGYHATGQWPFFGPDVVWTRSEIPGALQALLVGLPLRLFPAPEASYLLLNLLSFAAVAAFAWYVCARFPTLPRWLVWGWFLTIPWTIQFSTHLINTSYILPAALIFFIGFFETIPLFSLRRIPPPIAHAMMGAALLWLVQIHMSWPLLLPYLGLAWISRWRDGVPALLANGAAVAAGAALPGLLLLPTLLRYGIDAGSGGVGRNLHIHAVSPWIVVTTLARFFSFASLEVSRFIGTDGAKRFELFQRHLWLVPAAAIVWLAGVVQPLWMAVDWLRPSRIWPDLASRTQWNAIRALVAASVLLVYASYWFVMEPPQAHAFYVLAPIAFVFAAYWFTRLDSAGARTAAAWLMGISIFFHSGLAWARVDTISLYRNRGPVAAAVSLKQPEMLAHRRPFAVEGGPFVLADPKRPYDAPRDILVSDVVYTIGFRRSVHWTFTVRNNNPAVAFRDLLYITTYVDERGATVDERHEFIKDIFEPGANRRVDLNDGVVSAPFATAQLRIVAAEALLPAPP